MNLIGKTITGKWNNKNYIIHNLIGEGGIGRVYRVVSLDDKKEYALKISTDLQSITKESEMLTKFKCVGCVPLIYDLDDYSFEGQTYYFMVLELIEGYNLKEYIKRKTVDIKKALGVVIIIGEFIEKLHKEKFILGDLKLENIMIDSKNHSVKIVDLGGVTRIGSSISEFTPLYDRARWSMGLRRADEKYDLFSISMLMVLLILRDENKIMHMTIDELLKELKSRKINRDLINILKDGLTQKSRNMKSLLEGLKKIYRALPSAEVRSQYSKIDFIINTYLIGCIICFFAILFIVIT